MEHFPYYDRPYDPDDSFSNIPKQWKKIKGGSLSRSKEKQIQYMIILKEKMFLDLEIIILI
jgi:hypothetical protein